MREDYLQIKASVFNIQTYSIHDGPGIRVTVFLKGCPLRCIWCANPESNTAEPQLMTFATKCTGCGRCVSACHKKAISITVSGNKAHAVTDRNVCVSCGTCVVVCPSEAREITGSEMTVENVLNKVLRDRMFFEASGGGMTVSGGEPLMQPDFTEALLYAAKQAGIHTAIETCCFAAPSVVDRVFQNIDLGLLDIKHMDPAEHMRLTGVSNELILRNICHIHNDLGKRVVIRVPTIPGYNDSESNISETAKFVREELGEDVPIHLLPYHRLGESKSENLGNPIHLGIDPPSEEHMEQLKALVESFGLRAQIGG